jgi:hypothetical protein
MGIVVQLTSVTATAQFLPSAPAIPLLRNLIDSSGSRLALT